MFVHGAPSTNAVVQRILSTAVWPHCPTNLLPHLAALGISAWLPQVIQNEMKPSTLFKNNALVLKTLGSHPSLAFDVLKCCVPRLQAKRQSSLLVYGLPPVKAMTEDLRCMAHVLYGRCHCCAMHVCTSTGSCIMHVPFGTTHHNTNLGMPCYTLSGC